MLFWVLLVLGIVLLFVFPAIKTGAIPRERIVMEMSALC